MVYEWPLKNQDWNFIMRNQSKVNFTKPNSIFGVSRFWQLVKFWIPELAKFNHLIVQLNKIVFQKYCYLNICAQFQCLFWKVLQKYPQQNQYIFFLIWKNTTTNGTFNKKGMFWRQIMLIYQISITRISF